MTEEKEPRAPRKLDKSDHVSGFSSGAEELDDWLAKYAWVNQRANNAVTYVSAIQEGKANRVIAYYAIAVASVSKQGVPAKVAGSSPPMHIPCLLLGRLAVDYSMQGKGIGKGLLADALRRAVGLADVVGIRAILIHARDDQARAFYLRHAEFIPSPTDDLHLMISIKDVENQI